MNTRGSMIFAPVLLLVLPSACGQSKDAADPGSSTQPTQAVADAPPAFGVCKSCHAVKPGQNLIGPSLAGVWGRKAGSLPGYAYSGPLKASGITWDRASLDTWLQGPMQMVPGTRMVVGLPDPASRKQVIDYLETLK
jgi:cytochrome c